MKNPKKINRKPSKNNEKIFTTLLIIFAIIGLGLFVFWSFHDLSKQEIENLKKPLITKEEGISIANNFLEANNLSENLIEYSSSAAFVSYPDEIAFLEKSLGKKNVEKFIESNNLSENLLSIHFFKDSQKEEYFVDIDVTNKMVVSFDRIISDNKRFVVNNLSKEQAEEILSNFLISQGFSKENIIEQDYSSETKNGRVDHSFVYKIKNTDFKSDYGDSYINLKGKITGDKLTQFSYYINIPEDFQRSISSQEGSGLLLAILSMLASIIMFILSLVVLIVKFRKKQLNWKIFLIISIAALIFFLLNIFNNFPSVKYSYTNIMSYSVFIGIALVGGIIITILYAFVIFISGASGESLAREIWPEKITDLTYYIKGKLFTRLTSYSIFRGYLIGMVSLGITALIYLIGENYLGVWTMNMVDNTPLLFIPALSVLVISLFQASIGEEFTYRLFGISFFKKYFKSTLVALLIPTIIWAVAHSTYPVFPFYFRAVELLITGLFFGYFFLRYNITTVIVAHYLIDVTLIGFVLLFSGNIFNVISMIFILFIPFIIAIISLLKRS